MTTKQEIAEWLDRNQTHFTTMADEIWARPEIRFQEFFASKLQADFLEEAGFDITWDVGGMNTAFNFHPGYTNYASKGSTLGVQSMRFRFHGRTAHAAASPHAGRSALDAVELMNMGVNYLREHVLDNVRIHYVITNGGTVPNIVPDLAEVYYYVRAHLPHQVQEVAERVRKVAQGAAMMTETTVEEAFESGSTCVLNNHVLADVQTAVMAELGGIDFSDEEMAYAAEINANNAPGNSQTLAAYMGVSPEIASQPLIGDTFAPSDEGLVFPASTDVGDMSWQVPLSMLNTTCWPTNAAAHSWGVVASGIMGIGHKGMMYAAKVMALSAIELFEQPDKIEAARAEFEAATAATEYISPMPKEKMPPQFDNPCRS